MICFFLTVFSIPAWIPTSYKAYLSELEPYANGWEKLRLLNMTDAYFTNLENFKNLHIDKFDYLIEFEAPGYTYVDPNIDDIRQIDRIATSFFDGTYKFTYNFHKTVVIYSGVEILAFVSILLLLVGFILLVIGDVSKFVIYPLEKMFEKVMALSKDPMSVTRAMVED